MEILRFSIVVEFKKPTHLNIMDEIMDPYIKVNEEKDYKKNVGKSWKRLESFNLRALYSEESVIIHSEIDGIYYFVIDVNDSTTREKNRRKLDVLIKFERDDFSYVFNKVINEIKSKVKGGNIKIKLLKRELIKYHPYDRSNEDIIPSTITLKAKIEKRLKSTKKEYVFGIIVLVGTIIMIMLKGTEILEEGVKSSLIATGIGFLLSFLSKISFKYKLMPADFKELCEVRKNDPNNQVEQVVNDEPLLSDPL